MKLAVIKLAVFYCAFLVVTSATAAPSAIKTASPDKSTASIVMAGGTLDIHFKATTKASREAELTWVQKAAQAVSAYFGRFPVKNVSIEIVTSGANSKIGGTTWWGRKIQLRLGTQVTEEDLRDDWTATHEMFHLAFPQLVDDYEWMGEGLATYLEPLARARQGFVSAEQVWRELIQGLTNGAPAAGDRGLDFTHTWGRTYWGGAGFWFQADVLIREKTRNKKSIDTAMREILNRGGNGSQRWEIAQVISIADQATGSKIIADLHAKMGLKPGWEGFDGLFRKLGVSLRKGDPPQAVFDDRAPLASTRRSMTAALEPKSSSLSGQ